MSSSPTLAPDGSDDDDDGNSDDAPVTNFVRDDDDDDLSLSGHHLAGRSLRHPRRFDGGCSTTDSGSAGAQARFACQKASAVPPGQRPLGQIGESSENTFLPSPHRL
jgi:hypothetical protein